jgi:hypothetical protein
MQSCVHNFILCYLKMFVNEGTKNMKSLKRSVCYTGCIQNGRINFKINYDTSRQTNTSYKHVYGNAGVFLSLTERLQSAINAFSNVTFYLQLTQFHGHVYNTRSQCNNSSVLVSYKITIHNNCSKCLPTESVRHGHV